MAVAGGCPNPMGTARKKERRALSSRLAKARKLRGIKTNKKQYGDEREERGGGGGGGSTNGTPTERQSDTFAS